MFALIVIGVILLVVGGLWQIVIAFQVSAGWGVACLLIPFASIVFLFKHWAEVKTAFLTQLAGIVLVGVGTALSPSSDVTPATTMLPAQHTEARFNS